MFIDPYLDADFVSRYLPHVQQGVTIRLLGCKKGEALASAAESFCQQHGTHIEVRTTQNLHDRHVIIDFKRCFSSGASFKDGARRTGTTITETIDAADALKATYEELWHGATIK